MKNFLIALSMPLIMLVFNANILARPLSNYHEFNLRDALLKMEATGSDTLVLEKATSRDQYFTESPVSLTGVMISSAAWGDYDNDGFLDILITGQYGYDPSVLCSKIYKNNGDGTFSEQTNIALTGVSSGKAIWGDYDNDGYLDILLSGRIETSLPSNSITKIYKNNGAGNFVEQTGISIPGFHQNYAAWGDYDNDGYLDIVIGGDDVIGGGSAKIYKNNGNTNPGFTEQTEILLPELFDGSVAWGDYNNDDFLDLLITGVYLTYGWRHYSGIFKNNGNGTFTEQTDITITDMANSSVAWGDYDNDGDLDFLITGDDNEESGIHPYSTIYKNNGNDSFTELSGISLTGVVVSSVIWGDYDNDGDLDIFLSGKDSAGDPVSKIYTNNGNDNFTEETGTPFANVDEGAAAWGDYDNDGDLDLLLTGEGSYSSQISKIYINNNTVINTAPNAPSNLSSSVNGPVVTFSWNAATDNQTSSPGLNYNMRMGTTPGGNDVINPMANTTTGLRKVPQIGPVNSTSWTAGYLPTGTYYWSVQAIDPCFEGSAFAMEQSFSVVQQFTETAIPLTDVSAGSVAWGDYDNDDDLDILLAGSSSAGRISKIYKNNGNDNFVEQSNISLTGVSDCSLAWGDYNNDGFIDILLTGYTGSAPVSEIYKNNGDGTFTEQTGISLTPVSYSSVAWGDYNNDGFLDIVLTGTNFSGKQSKIYKNNKDGTFEEQTQISLTPVDDGSVSWSDYDHDFDLDLILTGNSNSGKTLKIYKNNGDGTFTESGIMPSGFEVDYSSVSWGDYNTSGTLEMLVCGRTEASRVSQIFGYYSPSGYFRVIDHISLPGVSSGSAAWGDYNNDGYFDILLTGYNGTKRISEIYKNTTVPGAYNNMFLDNSIHLPGVNKSAVAWGDYDNDGDLDILFTGKTNSGGISRIFKNNNAVSNTKPYPPENPTSSVLGNEISFSWDQAFDNETYYAGLLFNLRIGTSPGESDILNPMANISNGYRKLAQIGIRPWGSVIKDLPYGDYYWSVQTIDAAFAGSDFTIEQSFHVYAQFEETPTEITGVNQSSTAWGDYDNDGDLDILLTGWSGDLAISEIYKNNGDGTFTEESSISLTAVSSGSSAWGDYDNDGHLDILLTGKDINNQVHSKVYKNNGDQTFTEQSGILLSNVYTGSGVWGDYNNDGKLDILLTGFDGAAGVSKIYRNNGSGFTEQSSISLSGVYYSSAAWGDYNNDGDLDILLTGFDGAAEISKIYSNNGDGTFSEESSISLTGVQKGSAAWGDYDSDGDLDILLTGEASAGNVSKIYRNNGNNTFTENSSTPLVGVKESDAAWGDYNNDGYLDIILSGRDDSYTKFFKVYTNDKSGGFTEHPALPITPNNECSLAWGDYDNDGDLDIFSCGWTASGQISKLYQNLNSTSNTLPSAPSNLTGIAGTIGSDAVLSWDAASDTETPSAGLSYNLRIGTTPEGSDILDPMSIVDPGHRKVPALGNVNLNTAWTIKNLPVGTYYWGVQTIDNAFAGSAFAAGASFNITGVPDDYPGNALDFNGTNNFVNCGTAPQVLSNNHRTIEAWTYTESFNGGGIFQAGKPGADREDFSMRTLDADDEWRIQLWGSDDYDLTLMGSKNSWHHYALTYDGTTIKFYYDGELKVSNDVVLETEINDVYFGRWQDYYFDGKIDEVRIWNIARTQTELRENMHKTLSQDESGLIGYWQFNENTGTNAADNWLGNNGTLYNMSNDDWVSSSALWKRWEGTAKSTNWNTAENWSTIFSEPTLNDMVMVEATASQPVISNDPASPAKCLSLKIRSGAAINIDEGKALSVSDTIINEAGISGLVLHSNDGGTASLIHNSAGANATVKRYISKYVGDAGWHDLSSPVVGQAIRPEFVASPTPDPKNDFYKFAETLYLWISTKDIEGNWNAAFEDDFVVGRGYNVAYDEDVTKSFAGELNVGDFTFDETTTPAITFTDGQGNGWNLMGNPYPSAVDWDDCERTNIDGAVYVYDGDAGQYFSWNGSEGALTDGIIPPMNGFFIKTSENPSLTIPNDARVHTSINFYKSKNYVEDLLVLKVEGNGFSDRTYIHFNGGATNDFDAEFDAYKLSGISEAPQFYTMSGEIKHSINVLPYTNEEIIIPVGLKVGKEQEYTISVAQNTFWETVDISLKDLQTNITYNLISNNSITINHSPNNFPDRFFLLINGATGVEELQKDEEIQIYSYGDKIFIKAEGTGEVQIEVYNMIGQCMASETLSGFQSISGLNTGMYLIVIKTKQAIMTKKVYVR